MPAKRTTALGLAAYAAGAALLVLLHVPALVAVLCLTPLAFFVPGYAVALALQLDREHAPSWQLGLLAVALSMAIVAVGGLMLDTLFALTTAAWTGWLLVVTGAGSTLVFARAKRERGSESAHTRGWPRMRLRQIAALGIAVLALGGAVVVTAAASRDAYNKPLTQLSVLPAGDGSTLRVEVHNDSDAVDHLTLRIESGERSEEVTLTLRPSETSVHTVPAPHEELIASLRHRRDARTFARVTWDRPA